MNGHIRVGFVNSGILGHRSVAQLIGEAIAAEPTIDAVHVDAEEALTVPERIARRIICFDSVRQSHGAVDALLLTRWRHELWGGLVAATRLAAEERRGGPFAALHFHTQATAMASLRRMRRTPSVVSIDITQHLASLESSSALGPLAYFPSSMHDRAIFRAAAAIVSPSRWAAEDLARVHPECAHKVHTLAYPVRLHAFEADWADMRARRHAADSTVRVLFMGGDFPRKGGFELLDAWRAGGFAAGAELHLVTDWALPPDALPAGVHQSKGIRAFSPEWVGAWREADIFIMPTRAEAVGMVFQEAAAAGLPVIAPRLNAIPEIVEDGVTGLLVRPGDGEALARALTTLIANAERRHAMGVAARQSAECSLSVEEYGHRLSGLLHAAVRCAA